MSNKNITRKSKFKQYKSFNDFSLSKLLSCLQLIYTKQLWSSINCLCLISNLHCSNKYKSTTVSSSFKQLSNNLLTVVSELLTWIDTKTTNKQLSTYFYQYYLCLAGGASLKKHRELSVFIPLQFKHNFANNKNSWHSQLFVYLMTLRLLETK